MPPKTPEELREQIERQNEEQESRPGRERSAEGENVRTPERGEFLGNLKRVSKPDQRS